MQGKKNNKEPESVGKSQKDRLSESLWGIGKGGDGSGVKCVLLEEEHLKYSSCEFEMLLF